MFIHELQQTLLFLPSSSLPSSYPSLPPSLFPFPLPPSSFPSFPPSLPFSSLLSSLPPNQPLLFSFNPQLTSFEFARGLVGTSVRVEINVTDLARESELIRVCVNGVYEDCVSRIQSIVGTAAPEVRAGWVKSLNVSTTMTLVIIYWYTNA